MDIAYANEFSFFSEAQDQFDQLVSQLSSEDDQNSEHGNIEKHINQEPLAKLVIPAFF